jgi:hypothetical protein
MKAMQSPRYTAQLAALLGSLAIGCGTQIGNPTGSGIVRVTDDPGTLGTLVNAAFLQTVDGMNMGDYAYSRTESRVSTDRSCQTQGGTGLSLVDKADSRHSVKDETALWYALSEMDIKRSYEDAWTQNGALLACDPNARSVRFNYERLQLGPVRLESRVNEDLVRSLTLTDIKEKQELRHNLTFKKTGKRTLDFVNYAELGRNVVLEAQLNNQVESAISLPTADGGHVPVTMQLQERFPLDFAITLDPNQDWTRYAIASGRQEFVIPATGEVLRLEFRNVNFTREGGCVPVSGQLAATVIRPNEDEVRYSISFQPNAPLKLKADSGTETLVLAPFACVLKER